MALIDRGSRLTYAQIKAHFDGAGLAVQKLAAAMGDDFTSHITSGYSDNTVARDLDKAIDGSTTGLMGLTSVNALAAVSGPLDAMRRKLTTHVNAATTDALIKLGYGDYLRQLMVTFSTGYDDTYDNFWDAWDALWTSPEYIPGEVVDILNGIGIKVDPAYCHPPQHQIVADILFSGAETATMTAKDDIDPLLYENHTAEYYVVARNAVPDEITMTITDIRDEDDTPTEDGATDISQITVGAAEGAASVDDLTVGSSNHLCSVRGATLTVDGGGKADDHVVLRVKTLRSLAFPT